MLTLDIVQNGRITTLEFGSDRAVADTAYEAIKTSAKVDAVHLRTGQHQMTILRRWLKRCGEMEAD